MVPGFIKLLFTYCSRVEGLYGLSFATLGLTLHSRNLRRAQGYIHGESARRLCEVANKNDAVPERIVVGPHVFQPFNAYSLRSEFIPLPFSLKLAFEHPCRRPHLVSV